MKTNADCKKYIYWVPGGEFIKLKDDLESTEFKLKSVRKTSCEFKGTDGF